MKKSILQFLRQLLRGILFSVLIFSVTLTTLFFYVSAPPEIQSPNSREVNDVSRLNPIAVSNVLTPRSTAEIASLVRGYQGSISLGGARHSMGGQIAAVGSLHLDLRGFNRILSFDKNRKEICVEAGTTWRQIQEHIDPHDLSVMIMQTYADFTIGGSLSVNGHGRYVGQGPLIRSVKSIRVVLADGRIVDASRTRNSELFRGFIGGYGGLGVIAEATLELTENIRVERMTQVMPTDKYLAYFTEQVRNNPAAVFHNADIYPEDYSQMRAVSYVKTQKPVTETQRLKPLHGGYRVERFVMWLISEIPFGKWLRQNWGDPLFFRGERVEWRNYEASYDAMVLEPRSRKDSTYVLQEYFIPVARFDSFVPRMAAIFRRYEVNVINVSVRHANADPVSLLSWAKEEVFSFVVYYKQGVFAAARQAVGAWTRELIEVALSEGGTYYLPYQIHATVSQFLRAYPRSAEFFALKEKIDPESKFRNALWDTYLSQAR